MKKIMIFFFLTICTTLFAEITIWEVIGTPGVGDGAGQAYFEFRKYNNLHRVVTSTITYYYRDTNNDAEIEIYAYDRFSNWDYYILECTIDDSTYTFLDGPISSKLTWGLNNEFICINIFDCHEFENNNIIPFYLEFIRDPWGSSPPYTYSSKSFTLYKDMVHPDITEAKIVPKDPVEAIGPRGDGWYNMPVTIILTQDDPAAGPDYAKYTIDHEDNIDPPLPTIPYYLLWKNMDEDNLISRTILHSHVEIDREGTHTVYFIAWDKLGNRSDEYAVVTHIDTTPPDIVTGFSTSIESEIVEHGSEFSSLLLTWDEVTNDPGGSGFEYYNIVWKRKEQQDYSDNPVKVDKTDQSLSVDIDQFDRGVYYDFAVRSVDLVENASEWTEKLDVYIPPKVLIENISALTTEVNDAGEPVYKTVITLNKGTDVLTHITDIPIVLNDINLAKEDNSIKSNIDEYDNVRFPWAINVNGNLTFTAEHTGKNFAHQLLTYHIYTVHSEDLDYFEEYGNSLDVLLPNYAAPFEIVVNEVTDGGEEYIGRVDKYGFIFDSDNTNELFVNKKLRFYPVAIDEDGITIPNGQDVEGDRLKFNLYTINDSLLPMGPVYADTGGYIELELSLSKLLHLYGAITECFADGVSLASLYGSDIYQPQMTIHTANGADQGFYVLFDLDPPDGTFRITSVDGTIFYNMLTGTYTHNVSILIPENAITDATGVASSDLIRIDVYNMDISELSHPTEINEYDFPELGDDEKLNREPAPINLTIPRDTVPDVPVLFPWELIPSPGPDLAEYRLTVMEVEDRAGNIHFSWQFVLLDTRIPPAPDISTFHHIHGDQVIHVLWDMVAPGFTYEVTYPPITSSPVIVYEPEILIPVNGVDPDQEIDVTVKSVSGTGSKSPGVAYTIYTLPEPGELSKANQGYTAGDGHFLEWILTGGIAAEQELIILDVNGSLFGSLSPDQGVFTCTHLTAHESYNYKLIAYNSFVPPGGGKGDSVPGESDTVTLENNPPPAPVLLNPFTYASPLSVFSWEGGMTDIDDDEITYHVYVENGVSIISGSVQGNSYTFPPGSFLTSVQYVWYVVADDTPGPDYIGPDYVGKQTESAHVSIMLDGDGPDIEIADFPFFTNQNSLEIVVTDTVSGVADVMYGISDDQDGPYQVMLTNGIGFIPLHDAPVQYELTVSASDNAGNPTTKKRMLRVDKINPVIQDKELSILLPSPSGRYLCNDGKLPLILFGTDNFSGIQELHYGFTGQSGGVINDWDTIIIEETASPEGNTELVRFEDSLSLSKTDGEEYYLAVRLRDHAGNYSDTVYSDSAILYDTSPPDADLTIEGLIAQYGGFYIATISDVIVSFIAEDLNTGVISSITVTEIDGITDHTPWYSTWDDAKGYPFEDGKKYIITGKAVNGVGLETVVMSMPFVFDNTEPINLALDLDTEYEYIKNEQVRLTAGAEDSHSPLVSFRLGIGMNPGETGISMIMPGNVDGWLVAPSHNNTNLFPFTIPDIADGTYFVTLKVENAAGKESSLYGPSFTITINNSQEKVVVRDSGPYQSQSDTIEASWEYFGPGIVSRYQHKIHIDGEPEPDWTTTNDTSVQETGLSLANGVHYYVEARAMFADSTFSEPGRSIGVIVDSTPPEFTDPDGFITPSACTYDNLTFLWNATDDESGLAGVYLLFEVFDNNGDLVTEKSGWIEIPISSISTTYSIVTDASGSALLLETGWRVGLTLLLTNTIGLSIEQRAPDIIIDNSPPPKPFVTDQGDVIRTGQPLEASWLRTEDDPESGPVSYKWTVVQSEDELEIAVWYVGDETKQASTADISFDGMHGEVWYFGVIATNGAGLTSIGLSNGITYDDTAPNVAFVKLIDSTTGIDPETAEELNYVTSNEDLQLYFDAYEDISEITYFVTMGTWDGDRNFVPLSGESIESNIPLISLPSPLSELTESTILVFEGECRNEAGLVEYGYSRGTVLDTTTPFISPVEGFYSNGILTFQWEQAVSISPVTMYAVSLTREGNGPAGWIESGTATSYNIDINNPFIEDGNYVLWVQARNAAGRWSGVPQDSNPVTVDRTPPQAVLGDYSRFAASHINFSATGVDTDSGITGYEFRLGTIDVPDLFTGGWMIISTSQTSLVKTINFSELPGGDGAIPHNTILYLEIRVKNKAGLFSESRRSGPIIADKTDPDTPQVSAGEYTRFNYMIGDISFSSKDNESGITHYAVAIVNEDSQQAFDLAVWTEYNAGTPGEYVPSIDISGFEVIVPEEFTLSHGGAYYCAVKVENGAGEWSTPKASEVIRADFYPPTLEFDGAGITLIINDVPYTVPYTLIDDVSDTVEITFSLVSLTTGIEETFDPEVFSPGNLTYQFTDEAYGRYQLKASLKDAAGNIQPQVYYQELRVNEPPQVTMEQVNTTPGKLINLSAFIYDPDGDAPFAYEWDFKSDGTIDSSETEPEVFYLHDDLNITISNYTLTLTITDNGGKSVTNTTQVIVENTSKGRLYVSEYWAGTHYMRGDILVPEGCKLTLRENTRVIVTGDPLAGYDHRLTIEGNMESETGAEFAMEQGLYDLWNGIYISGDAILQGLTIKNAKRGLILVHGSTIDISECKFIFNRTGIHLLGVSPEIIDCLFENNMRYGIKEDKGAQPVVNGCTFTENTFDYYDEELTVLTWEELNTLDTNSGNKGE